MSNLLVKPSLASRSRGVRIGPVSLFALIVIVCMATLAVLTVSTAHSSLVLSQRQAVATQELYMSEAAAQCFLADLDEMLRLQAGGTVGQRADAGSASTPQGAAVLSEEQLVALRESALAAADGEVEVAVRAEGNNVQAEFWCAGGRTLKITVQIQPDGTYRIDRWKMTSAENKEQPIGSLYMGN